MTCRNCLHYDICLIDGDEATKQNMPNAEKECKYFKNKADYERLPCKVGDNIWVKDFEISPVIQEAEITAIEHNKYGTYIRYEYLAFRGRNHVRSIEYIGKTVFLTKKQADKHLQN